jgi:putative ABC transport system permease protein
MKGLVSLGLKNILRYKRRTIRPARAIGMGLMMFILTDSMLKGLSLDSELSIIKYEVGAGRIVTSEYAEDFEDMPLKETLDPSVMAKLEQGDFIWAPRIEFTAEMVFRKDPYPVSGHINVRVTAVDPQRDIQVFDLENFLIEGRYPFPQEEGVVLGSWLAEDMGIHLGYPVDLSIQTRFGGQELMELTVVGIVESPDSMINRGLVMVPLKVAQDYLEMDGQVTQIAVKAPMWRSLENGDLRRLKDLLQGTNGEFYPWEFWSQDFLSIAEGKQTSASTILFLVFIIAAVGISNTVLMSIFERVRELGMMRALGLTERDVRLLFLIESGAIGLLGSILGVIMGILVTWGMVTKGIDYSSYTDILREQNMGYRMASVFYGVWVPQTMILAAVFGVVLCVVIAWFSTKKINRLEITQCLRFQ